MVASELAAACSKKASVDDGGRRERVTDMEDAKKMQTDSVGAFRCESLITRQRRSAGQSGCRRTFTGMGPRPNTD